MKKCKKCGCMNNQPNNYCVQCGSKLPDKRIKYLKLISVLSVFFLGLNILPYIVLRGMQGFEPINSFAFFIFNLMPSAICIFSAIYSLVLLAKKESGNKLEKEFIVPKISFFVGVVFSFPAIAFDVFSLFVGIGNIIN